MADPAFLEPKLEAARAGDALRVTLSGDWALAASRLLEERAAELTARCGEGSRALIDLSGVARLDTAGAWLISSAQAELTARGTETKIAGARPEHETLLREARYRPYELLPQRGESVADLVEMLGRGVYESCREFYRGVAFLGEFVFNLGQVIRRPRQFRLTSVVYHIESVGFYSIPITALISFLVGAIVAQQGIFQLQKFGAATYAVALVGILVLRELGVLLASIMVAGRSGSAITAELGSMKMREEIDALRIMGLSPMVVLIIPRILALIISLPLITFLADMAALFGGMVVEWVYGGTSPVAFLSLLQNAIGKNTFFVGLFKAPFMAATIGIVAAMNGLATGGSAESLGKHVTASVVKSIFMVIVLDGLFAIFFAAINY